MYSYRVTKYNPIYRDDKGVYLRDEWISLSEVGSEFNGQLFTINDYLKIESLYVSAILALMQCVDINGLIVNDVVKHEKTLKVKLFHHIYTKDMMKLYRDVTDGQFVSGNSLKDLCKLRLRSKLGFRLEFEEKMFVHFGYDYYMYIGVSEVCKEAINFIEASDLFVEEYESPYYQEDED